VLVGGLGRALGERGGGSERDGGVGGYSMTFGTRYRPFSVAGAAA
jgi:hypothetical protein